jgi:hypothetical protein
MKMMTISDAVLVRLFEQFLTVGSAVWKGGSYNQADPTAYRKSEAWFLFDNCDPITNEQGEFVYGVSYHDVTWGVSIKIKDEQDKEVCEAYLDHQDGIWTRFSEDWNEVEFRTFLLRCMTDGEIRTKKPNREHEELIAESAAMARRAERDAGWDASP